MADREIKDAPIVDSVNEDTLKERLMKDHNVAMFSKLGTQLLEKTERPNIITLAQFEPFIDLFNADKRRYVDDEPYRLEMNKLYNRYVRELGINLYHPTIVIASKDDPRELYFLDRVYTRFKSDLIEEGSKRALIPAAIAKNASTTRDNLLLEASVMDLLSANNTDEQKAYFERIRADSALIQKNFVERNLSPEKRSEAMGLTSSEDVSGSSEMTFTIDDDD